MSKRKLVFLLLACLTVLITVLFQIEWSNLGYRIHQHQTAQQPDVLNGIDALSCIRKDVVKTADTYDPKAVDISELATHLPLVMIDTSEEIPGVPYIDSKKHTSYTVASTGEEYLTANLRIIDQPNTYHTPEDEPDVSSYIKIRVRGNTSRWFDKQSFAIKTVDAGGDYLDIPVMGMEENHDWALHGPFLDKTLMRNYMAMNIAGSLMSYAPDVRFCEVIVNGEYRGVYVMMETVGRGKGRIDIQKPNKVRNVTGYIIGLENDADDPYTAMNNYSKYTSILRKTSYFDIVYPGETNLTPELKDYIERDVSMFEKALYSYDYDSYRYGFPANVDVDEFVDYFILMEVFLQRDTGNLSTYFYKDVNGLFKPCVWDFNNDLDNIAQDTQDDFHIRQFVTVQAPWFLMMLKEESYIDRIIRRYRELRLTTLSEDYLNTYIDDTVAYLDTAVDRNYAVWGYSFDNANLDWRNKLAPDERNPGSYEEAVQQMKDTLFDRLDWLDENIEVLRQYGHESAVKKYNH